MGEVYHEYMIKRKHTLIGMMVRVLFILLCALSIVLSTVFGPVAFIVGVALAYATRYVFHMTDIEFEYQYLSGECQVDKICGKMKRKGCGKIEMDKVEIIAPEDSKLLEPYEKQVYKLRDFSSLEKDADRYVVFQRNDSTLIKVIFEPNEDIIREMKMASPRKVNIKGEERPY